MDVINIISDIYKKELAEANQTKIVALTQCEIYKKRIEQLEEELAQLKSQSSQINN